MADFPQLGQTNINPMAAFYDANTTSLANDLSRNTLASNTQIAANRAEGGSLANQFSRDTNPINVSLLRQQAGLDQSPALDRLMTLYGAPGGQPPAAPPPGGFTGDLSSRESSNDPSAVNGGGYSGMFQQGAARLSDPGVGVYTPAQGEDVNRNTWGGTFNIPGYPNVKTHADFLASPDAQRAALKAEVANTDAGIAATPGADKLNVDGLRAVAHLGGVAGMQKFVATGGAYNPADSNGTKLSDYYAKFSRGGAQALQAEFGHVDGPNAAAPGVTVAPGADGAAPSPAPVQTASRAPLPGDTATDAVAGPAPGFGPDGQPLPTGSWDATPVAAAPQAAPTGQGVSDVMARLRQTAAPQVQNPNALLSVAAPDGSAAPAPQNALAPAPVAPPAAPVAQPGTGMNSPQVQQAQQLMQRAAQIEMAAAQTPNEPRAKATAAAMAADLKARAAVLMQADSRTIDPVTHIQKSTLTGQEYSAADPLRNPARVSLVQTAGGTLETQPGSPDRLIPFSGRPEQTDAYKGDLTKTDALTAAAQSAQASMPRLNEMAALAGQLSTGPTAELRSKAAAMLQTLGAPDSAIKTLIGTSDAALPQEFIKLSIATAGSAAKADVGSNNGIQSTQLYQAANPNLGLLPDANKRITNMMRVSAQSMQDYAQAALQHFGTNETTFLKGGDYTPLTTFNRTWQAQANPQVYAAATGILNGDSFDKWSSKITPAEGARAAQIAARVDPTVQIPMKGGGMRPVGDVLSHPSIAPAAH